MIESKEKSLIDHVLALKESSVIEFKRVHKKPKEMLESVIAFSNTEGGFLILWVWDEKQGKWYDRLVWINENIEYFAEFKKLVYSSIHPALPKVDFIELEYTKNDMHDKIVVVDILKSSDIHSSISWDTFLRIENGNKKIGSDEIIRLKYEKWSLKFEDELSTITSLEDLDQNLLQQFKESIEAKWEDIWQILKDNWLAGQNKNIWTLKNSAVLLFAKNPSILLWRKCWIKISHYFWKKADFTGTPNFVRRPFSIEGPLLSQIDQAISYFNQVIKESSPQLSWSRFIPTMMIPLRVLQEVIVNAVIHRNYAIQNDIQVRIFDNKIEVESPWTYPWHMTSENIITERFARNPVILRTLNRFSKSPNLDIGEWVNRMFELMRKHNLYDPIYLPQHIIPNSVEVILHNLQKIEYWDVVNNYLTKNNHITNQEARSITGISDTLAMTRLLKKWVEQWLLDVEWEKRYTVYKKKGSDKSLFSERLIIEK